MENRDHYLISEKIGFQTDQLAKILNVFAKYPLLDKVVLYGSRAKGTFKPYSDIDITLFGATLDINMLHRLEIDLDDLNLPYTFDVSIFHAIQNQELIDHINRIGILIYAK